MTKTELTFIVLQVGLKSKEKSNEASEIAPAFRPMQVRLGRTSIGLTYP